MADVRYDVPKALPILAVVWKPTVTAMLPTMRLQLMNGKYT